MHPAHAGHERGERAHDRHEPGEDDRLAPVPPVELLRPLQVLVLEEPLVDLEGPRPDPAADRVVHRVTEDRGDRENHEQGHEADVLRIQRRHRPGREQQRIAREKGRDHQAGLAEDDGEQHHVGPRSPGGDQGLEVLVHLQENVEKLLEGIHEQSLLRGSDGCNPGPWRRPPGLRMQGVEPQAGCDGQRPPLQEEVVVAAWFCTRALEARGVSRGTADGRGRSVADSLS